MAKIAKVEVWGFESHVKTEYELSPGLTVLTGPSDSGKTSMSIRAIRWVAKGEPAGEEFAWKKSAEDGTVLQQAEEVGVRITMDNGVQVTKTRRSKKTKYWVTGYDEPFEKAEVPEAVKEALGIRPTVYGRDAQGKPELEFDLNFAYQLDAPFLLSMPGSAGAKVLGKLAGTEAIDLALKAVAKDTYAARSDKAAADKEYERKVMQLLDYQNLEEIKAEVEACEWLIEQTEKQLARKESMVTLAVNLDGARNRLRAAEQALEPLMVLDDINEDLKDIEKAQQRYDTLLDLYGKLSQATATVESLTQQINELNALEPAAWLLEGVEKAAVRRQSLENLSKEYSKYTQSVKNAQEIIEQTKDLDYATSLLDSSLGLQLTLLQDIKNLRVAHAALQDSQQRLAGNLEYLNHLPEAEALLGAIRAANERLIEMRRTHIAYASKATTAERAQESLREAEQLVRKGEQELAAAWEEAGGVCPLCGHPTDNHLH